MTIAVIVFVAAVFLIAQSIVVVPQAQAWVVERLGRYKATLQPGLNVRVPLIDRIARKHSLVSRDVESSAVAITLDNIPVTLKATATWQIIDAEKATYATADVAEFMSGIVLTALRQAVAQKTFEDVRETTRELQQTVLRSSDADAATAGVQISAIALRQVERREES